MKHRIYSPRLKAGINEMNHRHGIARQDEEYKQMSHHLSYVGWRCAYPTYALASTQNIRLPPAPVRRLEKRSAFQRATTHLLTLCQYIELNTARARMVTLPGQYPWSSYRHNAMAIPIGLITEHEEYKNLGNTHSARILNYRKLFPTNLSGEILEEIRLYINKE